MRSRYAASRRASSPLTRGKLALDGLHPRPVRLIPAHAGKTPAHPIDHRRCRAHPRSRGENELSADWTPLGIGSSPLTRGKQSRVLRAPLPRRLIPAHARKTHTRRTRVPSTAAHPRSRGENARALNVPETSVGSSPLTRGKLEGVHADLPDVGLIPAHTGKTGRGSRGPPRRRAHPRSHGENACSQDRASANMGSSPLTRGKLANRHHAGQTRRLIPAHAGKTAPFRRVYWSMEAHPRSRGENSAASLIQSQPPGSSPLTRGKRSPRRGRRRSHRLIPAHTGKTWAWLPRVRPSRAHPRSRGENSRCFVSISCTTGSSPLTRGKPPTASQRPS